MWRGQGAHVECLHYAAEGEDGGLLGFLTVYEVGVCLWLGGGGGAGCLCGACLSVFA
jgi:hypothetical protein